MKKISFNDYIPKELADNESCRLITEEQYKEWKACEKKLDIVVKALKETKEKLLNVELSGLDGDNRQKMYDLMFADGVIDKALKQIKEVL